MQGQKSKQSDMVEDKQRVEYTSIFFLLIMCGSHIKQFDVALLQVEDTIKVLCSYWMHSISCYSNIRVPSKVQVL